MREVLPGVFHWRAIHPKLKIEVDSHWLDEEGVLIDPLVPPDVGIEWFAQRAQPPTRSCSPSSTSSTCCSPTAVR